MEYAVEMADVGDYCTVSADGEYFVQFCDPPLPSFVSDNETLGEFNYDVILMLDASGSMFGEKLNAAVDALSSIIDSLDENDTFNVIRFANRVNIWRQQMVPTSQIHLDKAKEFLSETRASGGTDLEGALKGAINLAGQSDKSRIPFVFYLTDGGPNTGTTDFQTLINDVSRLASQHVSINGVALGSADPTGWQLVQRISARNRGLSQRIFDITKFGHDIPSHFRKSMKYARSMRGLTDVKFQFDADVVKDLTNTNFAEYTFGQDLVVLGKLNNRNATEFLDVTIQYQDVEGQVWKDQKKMKIRQIERKADMSKFAGKQTNYNPIKQQWAVTAVHQLLQKRSLSTTEDEYAALTKEAKDLSYDCHIVSPVVSFLVRKPKSALNLIDSRKLDLDTQRAKRGTVDIAETHEVRYQFRKLWWRNNKDDDDMEDGAEEQQGGADGNIQSNQNWIAMGGAPLYIVFPMTNGKAVSCMEIPNSIQGTFALLKTGNGMTITAHIVKHQIVNILFSIGRVELEIDATRISARRDEVRFIIDETKNVFKVDQLIIEQNKINSNGEKQYLVTEIGNAAQYHVTQGQTGIDLEIIGIDSDEGLLGAFSKVEAQVLEKTSPRQMQQTTIWIDGNLIPVSSMEIPFLTKTESRNQCWKVKPSYTMKVLQ